MNFRHRHSPLLDKNIDFLCLGKNISSFLLAVRLLKRKHKVLLLDDYRFHIGNDYMYSPFLLEWKLLRAYGEYENIQPLVDLEHYTHQRPYILSTSRERLLLGGLPSVNLLELSRKLPRFFQVSPDLLAEPQHFDELYFSTVKRLATSAHQFLGADQLNFQLFMTQCPKALKDLYFAFESSLKDIVQMSKITPVQDQEWAYLFRSFFHHHLTIKSNQLELFHLFLSLLSPRYQLDRDRLHEGLLDVHLHLGGQFKSTWVREWKFEQGRPWSLELASFDGIVHPDKVCLHGVFSDTIPIRVDHGQQPYSEIIVRWTLKNNDSFRLGPYQMTYTNMHRMGTDFPLWKLHQENDQLVFSLPMKFFIADKLEFQTDQLRKGLRSDLEELFGLYPKSFIQESLEDGYELWTSPLPDESDREVTSRGGFDLPTFFQERPHELKKVRNLCSFSPLGRGRLGLFSTLLTLREAQIYL